MQVQIEREQASRSNFVRSRKISKLLDIFSTHSTTSYEAAEKLAAEQQGQDPKDDSAPHRQQLTTLGAVALINAQFEGLIEGYAARVASEWAADPVRGPERLGKLQRIHHIFMQNNGEALRPHCLLDPSCQVFMPHL